ncbi:13564_t:CDS:2 [Funneliformis geosporum]|uniref:13564_t:CDS:1 n=1 Tax=Funneliformis geosporum TaxID=1117311 RepID=A0A9W4SD27_9GLOM|nr:13564_t:CDS:2 [Funneliformis geosporum]
MVTMKIIIASIGGTVGAFIIITCGFLFYRWNRNRNEQPGFINGEQHNLPGRRLAHSTALVENKLYFFGGCVDITKSCTNQVFYLDLSQSFNLAAPPWVSLTQKAGIPFKNELLSSLYFMYLNSLSWHAPVVEGTSPERRRNIRGIIYNTGNIYILGGFVDKALARKPYHSYTTTLLSNGVIVYIGASANITTNSGSSKTQSSPISSIIVANNEMVTMKIIIASIGGTVGAVIIIACGILFYRWNRNRIELDPGEHKLPGSIVENNYNSPGFINREQHNLPGSIVENNYNNYIA